ncbi:RNA exonuclease 1-like protein [Anas platyrhynchos]|uniref:RNA exonuclease 1-like protein n=1 Tax=Anas platyrhynchos TaxID=8839 RepID=R0LSS0_ANAPL|nr:RNA exonuclease 1-like protein [Anas platyrhynchos]
MSLLVQDVTSSQPSALKEPPFPSLMSTNSSGTAGSSDFCLEMVLSSSFSLDLELQSLLTFSFGSLLGTEVLHQHTPPTKNIDKSSSVQPVCRNKKEGEKILSSSAEDMESSGEDTEISESDDPIEECRRIFEEFEKEAQKKDSDKQTHEKNVDASLLETEVNVAGQKRRITDIPKFDVCNKNEMEPFKRSPVQQGPKNPRIQTAQLKARELIASIATDSGQEKSMSKQSAIQIQTSSDLLEVQPVEIVSGQLHKPSKGNAEIAMPCKLSVRSIEKTALMLFEARIEEQSIYDRCGSKNMYLNFAVKTVKKLRDHGQSSDIKTPSGAGSVKADNEKVPFAAKLLHFQLLFLAVAGGLEKHYSCCEGIVGSPGCQIAKCYTSQGLELTRVTVVDDKLQVVYDTFVKPHNEVIDYNTSFSGVTEDNLKNTKTTLRDVQAVLLNLFSADTILIGHSLENDFFVLKLIHDTVVDTSILFPHRLGPPNKRALRSLMADYLMRIHQGDGGFTDEVLFC